MSPVYLGALCGCPLSNGANWRCQARTMGEVKSDPVEPDYPDRWLLPCDVASDDLLVTYSFDFVYWANVRVVLTS